MDIRKVILQEFITIDGFAAEQNGELNFFNSFNGKPRKDMDEDILRFMDTVDTILLGAVTYRLFLNFWPSATSEIDPIADKLNMTPKIVFSHTLNKAPWGQWNEAKVIQTSAVDEVARLKQQPGKNMVLWGSISLAQSLMKAGLIDECQLRICPVVLGSGRSLFSKGISMADMQHLRTKTYDSGLVRLDYQPTKI